MRCVADYNTPTHHKSPLSLTLCMFIMMLFEMAMYVYSSLYIQSHNAQVLRVFCMELQSAFALEKTRYILLLPSSYILEYARI